MKVMAIGIPMLLFCGSVCAATLVPEPARAPSEPTQQAADCDKRCALRAQVDRHLLLMGEFDNDRAQERSLRELAAAGPAVVRAVHEAYDDWSRAERQDPNVDARPGEMRWRATYLLGALGIADARRALYEIARAELQGKPRGDVDVADEARIKVRAVDGLMQLKAIDELKALHELGGSLSNTTAAALFELGVNVGGVRLVETRVALAAEKIDSKDYKPNKGRPAQLGKPGSERFKVNPREDSPSLKANGG